MTVTGEYSHDAWFGIVRVDGRTLSPERSQRVYNHSPDGFAWGYSGSGPAQLALAILLEAGLSKERALRLHQSFKLLYLADVQPDAPFLLTMDVADWANAFEAEMERL